MYKPSERNVMKKAQALRISPMQARQHLIAQQQIAEMRRSEASRMKYE